MCTEGTFLCAELLVCQYVGLCFLSGFPTGFPPGLAKQMPEASMQWHMQQAWLWPKFLEQMGADFQFCLSEARSSCVMKHFLYTVHFLNYQVEINGSLGTAEASMFLFRHQSLCFFFFLNYV